MEIVSIPLVQIPVLNAPLQTRNIGLIPLVQVDRLPTINVHHIQVTKIPVLNAKIQQRNIGILINVQIEQSVHPKRLVQLMDITN